MEGTFETRRGEEIVEKGTWSYRGFGNAEIELHADGEIPQEHLRYDVRIHSAERQLEHVRATSFAVGHDGDRPHSLSAVIAGSEIQLTVIDPDGSSREGRLSVPDETVYDGISPIWLIHLFIVDLPPADRQVVTPVISFGPRHGAVEGAFYRVRRDGAEAILETLDEAGRMTERRHVLLAEDGCPTRIESADTVTDIVRIPVTVGGPRS